MAPATSERTEFIFPYKRTDGPLGDSYANVMDFQRLNNAVARTEIRYVERILGPNHVDDVDADILASTVLNLEDCR